jgi:hypothetical protein
LYNDLVSGLYYRLSGYIDHSGNGIYDGGEITALWEGLLKANEANAKLNFKQLPPTLEFLALPNSPIELARGESFNYELIAEGNTDHNWTSTPIINGTAGSRTIIASGNAIDVLQLNGNRVNALESAAYDAYSLSFTAYDLFGTASEPLVLDITITDKSDPVITIQSNPYPWPLGTEWNPSGIYSATDDPDGNITSDVQVNGLVDTENIGEYLISLYVEDAFGRATTEYVAINVTDLSPPTVQFYNDDSSISWLLGVPFVLPENYVTATDNVDGDLSDQIEVSGINLLDENIESNQTVYFAVTDSSGNRVENQPLTISFEQPSFSIAGVAIDGYLSGSSVEFIPADPNLNHLKITGTTDANGSFDLYFLEDDFVLIDSNVNGIIDPTEGTIVVVGGIDTTTNQSFTSALSADANSTVITPLTTILSEMVKNGTPKEQAQAELAASFGYSDTIDITHYDPILAAKTGDTNTSALLQANALIANTLKQITAITEASNINAQPVDITSKVANQLGELVGEGSSLRTDLQLSTTLENLVEETINEIDQAVVMENDDLSSYTEVLKNSNLLLTDNTLQSLSPGVLLKELSQKQIAIEQEVLGGYEKINKGSIDLETLKNEIDVEFLKEKAKDFISVNNFMPEGESFEKALGRYDFLMGEILQELIINDADGDLISVSIVDESGELDIDGDNLAPFGINSSYQLIVLDASDVEVLLSENEFISINLRLDDNNGKVSFMEGKLTGATSFQNISSTDAIERSNSNNYSFLDAVLNEGTSWYKSVWFGEFYPGRDGWIYHYTLGWLYLHSTGQEGFWIWDSHYDAWWWTSRDQNVFPYFYLHGQGDTTGWGKFENLDSQTRVYEYFNKAWKVR